MARVDLDDLKRVLAEHKQRHAQQEYPFCEDFGCMSIEPLVVEVERLRQRETALLGLLRDLRKYTGQCEVALAPWMAQLPDGWQVLRTRLDSELGPVT